MGENKKWISLKRRLGKKVEGGDIVQKENLFPSRSQCYKRNFVFKKTTLVLSFFNNTIQQFYGLN